MGMFDTFYGEVRCPYCGELHKFEEQTKSYDCIMSEFKLGDYIDKANETYNYPFKAYCYKFKQFFNVQVLVFKGQIIKFVNEDELKEININKLENIEEGLGRKLEYLERCKQGIGINNDVMNFGITLFKNEESNWNEHPKKNGDKLFTLDSEWVINDVYKEILVINENDKASSLYKLWYHDNFVYKVIGNLGSRIIRVTDYYTEVFYDNGFKKEYDIDNPNDYFLQYGCELQKIE